MNTPESLDALEQEVLDHSAGSCRRVAFPAEVTAVFAELREARAKNEQIDYWKEAVRFAEARAEQDRSIGAAINLGRARTGLADAVLGRTPERPILEDRESPPNLRRDSSR